MSIYHRLPPELWTIVGDFVHCNADEVANFCRYVIQCPDQTDVGLLFSFDGASRNNPGEAAQGNGGWWGAWRGSQFEQMGELYHAGRKLGRFNHLFFFRLVRYRKRCSHCVSLFLF